LIAHGWNLKRLHRLILTSNTYRMSSIAGRSGSTIDPDDALLWHFPRRRLEGEAIRDAMLACSGQLRLTLGGPPVVPPLGKDELTGLFDADLKWQVTRDGAEHGRRSVYLLNRRTFVYPFFAAFDPPEVMTSCARRMQTTVPAQALTLLNSPLARDQARAFAIRLLRECGEGTDATIQRAWLLAFGRPAASAELSRAAAFVAERMAQAGPPSPERREDAWADLCLALYNSNEFVQVD
jgi:hypothetical protein